MASPNVGEFRFPDIVPSQYLGLCVDEVSGQGFEENHGILTNRKISDKPRCGNNDLEFGAEGTAASMTDRLPLEIHILIFELYRDSCPNWSLMTLGAVCRTWRSITWSAPRLWTTLDICLSERPTDTWFQLLGEWLTRSKSLPLTIIIETLSFRIDVEDFPLFYPVIDLINQSSHRWYALQISAPSELITRLSDATCTGTSSILHRLSITCSSDIFDFPLRKAMPTKLYISGEVSGVENVNWTNLTRLHIDDISVIDALKILPLSPQLLRCSLAVNDNTAGSSLVVTSAPITHPNLQHLKFRHTDEFNASFKTFFRNITLVAIKTLVCFGILDLTDDSTRETFVSFLERSSTHLKNLTLEGSVYAAGRDLIRVAAASPWVMRFKLHQCQESEEAIDVHAFLNAFDAHLLDHDEPVSVMSQPLWPNLHSINWSVGDAFPWELLPRLFARLSREPDAQCRPIKLLRIRSILPSRYTRIYYIDQSTVRDLSPFASNTTFHLQIQRLGLGSSLDLWNRSREYWNVERQTNEGS